jgi:DNA polymerase II small subunit
VVPPPAILFSTTTLESVVPLETPVRIAQELLGRGYNADRGAVTLIAESDAPEATLDRVVEDAPDDALKLTASDVKDALAADPVADPDAVAGETADADGVAEADTGEVADADAGGTTAHSPDSDATASDTTTANSDATTSDTASATTDSAPPVSAGTDRTPVNETERESPVETEGSSEPDPATGDSADGRNPREPEIENDITGRSTGTGEYEEFVTVFRDRYERLAEQLRGRVNHRPADSIEDMSPGSDVAMIGLVNDIRSTASGHWLIELEDTSGTFPALVMKDRELADTVDELLMDECIAIEGSLSDDAGLIFADSIYFPEVPRTYRPSTADREVQAALISDVHVGSQEFMADAWERFADWLHTPEAQSVEYLLIAGDMVEGVGVYPDQDEELDIIDIFDQYREFSERLKSVPGDMEIVMIPGNHDAVRLAEPQPGFDDELRDIMSAHDARITGNPSTVTIEGVSILMYHGVSLDELIAEMPEETASYDEPHRAMYQLLKKRHVAPQYGGKMRLAPEKKDYLVIDDVPDVFHTGHVHKVGWGKYHNVLSVNTGCWQAQTDFQKSVNIDPDVAHAPILDLDTLDMTVRKFA